LATIDYASPQPRQSRPGRLRGWWYPVPLTGLALLATLPMPWLHPWSISCLWPVVFVWFLSVEVLIGHRRWSSRRGRLVRGVAFALFLAAMLGLRPRNGEIFTGVFKVPPPAGVSDVSYELGESGPIGPHVLLRFHATPAAMALLVSGPNFVRNDDLEKRYAQSKVSFDAFVGDALLEARSRFGRWEPTNRSGKFEVYGIIDAADSEKEVFGGIVYDPATGEVLVHREPY
jgi:hypothetical protein